MSIIYRLKRTTFDHIKSRYASMFLFRSIFLIGSVLFVNTQSCLCSYKVYNVWNIYYSEVYYNEHCCNWSCNCANRVCNTRSRSVCLLTSSISAFTRLGTAASSCVCKNLNVESSKCACSICSHKSCNCFVSTCALVCYNQNRLRALRHVLYRTIRGTIILQKVHIPDNLR